MKINISRRVAALIILTVILTTGFMAYGLMRLESTTKFREFLPKDSPAIKTTEEFENTFDGGAGGAESILVEATDVTQAEIFLAILRLENEIKSDAELLEYIGEVNSYADYILPHLPAPPFSIPEPQLENYIQLILSNPSVGSSITRILSENRTTALIIIQTTPGFSGEERSRKLQRLSEIVETFQENYKNIVFELTGDQTLHAEIMEIMNGDNRILIPSAAAFVVVILFFTFRKLSDIGLSMLVVGLGAVWAVGAMGWLGMKFTMLHVALVPL
ncbi:MAG: MMPL family transporter, partial [Candidatus Hadarchaeales archaeon]